MPNNCPDPSHGSTAVVSFPKSLNINKDERFCQCDNHQLRGMREAVPNMAADTAASEIPDMLPSMQRQGTRSAMGDTRTQRSSGPQDVHADVRGQESGVEGRCDAQTGEGELFGTALCAMPAEIVGDGTQGRLCDGAPFGNGAADWADAAANRMRESHQPESAGQPARELGTVPDERGPQAWRGWPVCRRCGKPALPRGLGTALKPAWEPIIVARKPLQGTVAANVLAHGTGALNIDACRVATTDNLNGGAYSKGSRGADLPGAKRSSAAAGMFAEDGGRLRGQYENPAGRWPTNVVLDETQATELMSRFFPTFKYEPKAPTTERPSYYQQSCECENACPITPREKATAATMSPECSSTSKYGNATTVPCPTDTKSTTETKTSSTTESKTSPHSPQPSTNDFIQDANSARASGSNLVDSATNLNLSTTKTGTTAAKAGHYTDAADHATSQKWSQRSVCANCGAPAQLEAHATVKPVDLIRWLIRLVTPPGGTVLDPFAGTGTTAEAAIKEHKQAVLIEREDTYLPLIVARLSKPMEIGFNFEESA